MTLLFRACFGFLIAFAAVQPQPLTAYFGTQKIAALRAELANAERAEAARSPLDAAILSAAGVLRAMARIREESSGPRASSPASAEAKP